MNKWVSPEVMTAVFIVTTLKNIASFHNVWYSSVIGYHVYLAKCYHRHRLNILL